MRPVRFEARPERLTMLPHPRRSVVDPGPEARHKNDTYQHSDTIIIKRRQKTMKNMIVMMNAMKYYNHDALACEDSDVRRMLDQELTVPARHQVADKIRQKYFQNLK